MATTFAFIVLFADFRSDYLESLFYFLSSAYIVTSKLNGFFSLKASAMISAHSGVTSLKSSEIVPTVALIPGAELSTGNMFL